MNETVNPEMLILARESRGMIQSDLATAASISQANISKYESGIVKVKPEHLAVISRILGYPKEFFFLNERKYGFASSCTYHRKRETAPIKEMNTALAQINVIRIHISRLLNGVEMECANQFQRLDLDEYDGDVEQIARQTRINWRIPNGPITNLIEQIESAGGIVFRCSFGTRKIDAISQWLPNLPPIFFVNDEIPTDRMRWSLAHEIGHLIMHQFPTDFPEKEADRFAAAFLMPAGDIYADLISLTTTRLPQLKLRWKVSMQSISRRAYDLKLLTDWQYRNMCQYFAKTGQRTKEPVELPAEIPSTIDDLFRFYQQNYQYSSEDLCRLLYLEESEIANLYSINTYKGLRLIG
jgi:Zn-dependent peptidase ImmA (M78 family)/transcriptional regulator with XRE-family HTH domain